jgi:hypothetical protein
VFADNRVNDTTTTCRPLLGTQREPRSHGVPFDVVAVNDDVVPSWYLTVDDLARYSS